LQKNTPIEQLHNIILVYMTVVLQLRLFISKRLALIGQWRFRMVAPSDRTEWCGSAWDREIANGVIVSWNFYNIISLFLLHVFIHGRLGVYFPQPLHY